MFNKTKISAAAALLISGMVPAFAQTADKAQTLESVVVTGSRIVRPNLESNTPVVAVTTETLQNIGVTNFADMATQLPQFAPSFGSSRTQSTFSGVESSGLQQTNLRNLASVRSLVLLNGRRFPGGTTTGTGVDFNSIPTANIDRIEVITGGAAAIYGADAVAGVVNIITKKNFSGIELNVQYNQAGKGDNKSPSASIVAGSKFGGDAGRAMLTMEIHKDGHVSCKDRDYCSDDFAWTNPQKPAVFGPAARSGVPLAGRFFPGDGKSYTRRDGKFTDAAGKLIEFSVPLDGYNRNANRDVAIPTRRLALAGELEYKVNKNVTAFGEFNYASTTVDSSFEGHPFQSQAAGSTFGGKQATILVDNPFMPKEFKDIMVANKATEMTWFQRMGVETLGNNRGGNSARDTMRAVVGAKGEFDTLFGIGEDWKWDASHVFGRTTVKLGTEGTVSLPNLYNGLRVRETAPGSGKYECIDAQARAQGCVPINPFAPYTKAMSDYLSTSVTSTGEAVLNDTIISLSGSAFKLPAGDVRTAFGLESRTQSGGLDHDSQLNLGNVSGNLVGDTDSIKIKTREVFAEVLVPVLADKPFIKALNLEGAYRHSNTANTSYNTWKFGGDWEPTDGLRFRAMTAKAVRTPVAGELSGIGQTAGTVNDPCTAARRNANPTRAANCAADGVPADYAPPLLIEQGVSGLSGGNANLKPETAKTLTFGVVFQPQALKGFTLAVDRFDIRVKDIITTVDRPTAVNLCYDTPDRQLCGSKKRGASPLIPGANYVLLSVDEQQQNVASQDIAGVDIDARYAFKTAGWGDFDISVIGTVYDKASWVPLSSEPAQNLLGQAGGTNQLSGYIKVSGNANLGWKMGPFKANWNLRYLGRSDMAQGTTEDGYPQIGAHTYHNVRLGYTVYKGLDVYAGVTNLLDKKPPMFGSSTAGTQALDTIPGYYDVFGRSFYVGATMKF